MMREPTAVYLQQVASGKIENDERQRQVLQVLDATYHHLVKRQQIRSSIQGQVRRKIKPRSPIRGLYLWGGVGIGKTHLMDIFYHCVPVKKMRCHFHVFMRELHRELRQAQGQEDPLKKIAKKISDEYLLICFDEFFVSNITDAMLLGELFKFLFVGGICLVATSNIGPQDLYRDGLQREHFLPTIALIEKFTTVIHLQGECDYRLRHLHQAGVYYSPLDQHAQDDMELCFEHFSRKSVVSTLPIQLFDRTINIQKQAGTVIWFDFCDICTPPRSQNDYLAISEHYETVLVSDIPQISEQQTAEAILLITLVDVLYDHHVRLVVSAAVDVEELYTQGQMHFEFRRTQSRLIEMNSTDYFSATSG